jgi:CubicO group peptidase (beta-lactamase class C family)
MKKIILRSLLALLLVVIILGVMYAWNRVPIITSYAAKGMCSSVFMANRSPALVSSQDLSFFPISLAKTKVNYDDQSVTATVFGLAKRKAVYREGLGATPVADFTEDQIRAQAITDMPYLTSNPDSIDWPLGNRYHDTLFPEINYQVLDTVIAAAFDAEGAEPCRKTHAVMVLYKDIPLREKYATGIAADTRLIGWSMSKSITNAMVGILISQGKLSLEAPAPVPEWSNDERSKITLNDLMHMKSGLAWVENYFDLSDVTRMLYSKGDMYAYAISRPFASMPGTQWNYSTGNTIIICGIIRHTFTDPHDYYLFPHVAIFNRLGMRNTLLEADAAGTFTGSSYCFASTHDWARFGLMLLHNGVFAGDTILTADWINYSRQPVPESEGFYGAHFWVNAGKELPNCPTDIFYQRGFNGQRVFVLPSQQMVIIRLGYSEKNFDFDRFVSGVVASVQKLE